VSKDTGEIAELEKAHRYAVENHIHRNPRLGLSVMIFSAYSISDQLIGGLEALFIRIAPNDIINVRIEASEMRAFPDPEI
jgi:hypothetical protein